MPGAGAGAGAAEQFYSEPEPEPEPECFPGAGAGAGADQKCHGSASLLLRNARADSDYLNEPDRIGSRHRRDADCRW